MYPRLKNIFPRSLYGRAVLILIVPIVTTQLVVSITFIQRHYDDVTRQMTNSVLIDVQYVLSQITSASDQAGAATQATALARALDLQVLLPAGPNPATADQWIWWDLSAPVVIDTVRSVLPQVGPIDLRTDRRLVQMFLNTRQGPVAIAVSRGRVSASNPHQLLVLMIVTSILMTLIAYMFLRNQLRPIKKLADAATDFGKGRTTPYRPKGALEVRAAGAAFLDMRARIERQIEQRTLLLSGVSHDLRTPLTRLRLGLAMQPDDAETQGLLRDVADMERLVDEFLSFVRGDAMEEAEMVDPVAIAARAVQNAQRGGHNAMLHAGEGQGQASLRPNAVIRALDNLIGNAVRYGTRAEVSVVMNDRSVRLIVEDDGPGIPKDQREAAMMPFTRLDGARDPNKGGGVGLGLSIAADIARSHGGSLRLGESESLGGLRAELVLAR